MKIFGLLKTWFWLLYRVRKLVVLVESKCIFKYILFFQLFRIPIHSIPLELRIELFLIDWELIYIFIRINFKSYQVLVYFWESPWCNFFATIWWATGTYTFCTVHVTYVTNVHNVYNVTYVCNVPYARMCQYIYWYCFLLKNLWIVPFGRKWETILYVGWSLFYDTVEAILFFTAELYNSLFDVLMYELVGTICNSSCNFCETIFITLGIKPLLLLLIFFIIQSACITTIRYWSAHKYCAMDHFLMPFSIPNFDLFNFAIWRFFNFVSFWFYLLQSFDLPEFLQFDLFGLPFFSHYFVDGHIFCRNTILWRAVKLGHWSWIPCHSIFLEYCEHRNRSVT